MAGGVGRRDDKQWSATMTGSGRQVPPLFLRNNNQLTMTIMEEEATCDGEARAGGKEGGRGEGGREREQ
jgi:hypothetical protein